VAPIYRIAVIGSRRACGTDIVQAETFPDSKPSANIRPSCPINPDRVKQSSVLAPILADRAEARPLEQRISVDGVGKILQDNV